MTETPKSNRTLIAALVGLVVIGLAGSIFYFRSTEQAPERAADATPAASPVASAAPTEASSPAPTAAAEPAKAAGATAQAVDLSVDEEGLSKTSVLIETPKGAITFKFYPKDAPNTVTRFVELVQKGFYNGLNFHRVVPGFVIQGGDPAGNGTGGSGQKLKAEFNARKHVPGAVAMARAQDPDSADSQFYIALGTLPHLDGNYTVFGKVVDGLDVIQKIEIGDKMTKVSLK